MDITCSASGARRPVTPILDTYTGSHLVWKMGAVEIPFVIIIIVVVVTHGTTPGLHPSRHRSQDSNPRHR